MAKQEATISHRDIVDQIRKADYKPIYLLMGEESYYIDKISEFIAESVLPEAERDFNQQIIYCTRETQIGDIINAARRYPMMAEHQVVIVKEAQNLLKFEDFALYAKNPLKTTILVICYKNKSADRRSKAVSAIEKVGIVYESKKLREGQIPTFIVDYLKRKQITIDQNAQLMLVESIGSDLNRMACELDKLVLGLPAGFRQITSELVEKNIGISKEFNNWELRNAIVAKDIMKANRIIRYFNENPKSNPPTVVVSMLFNFFSNMMLAYYAPDKTPHGIMEQLDFRNEWQVKDYISAMRNYTAMKTLLIIGKIRETDARLKGIEKGNISDGDLMKELIYFILH